MQNYTGRGWEGKNYDNNLSTKEITKIVRQRLKKEFSECKFSVRYKSFAGGSSISCALVSAPFDVFTEDLKDGYIQVNHFYIEKENIFTDKAKEVLKKVTDMFTSFNYNDSDAQIDYFSTNFYFHLEVGQWDKPFIKTA
ncbi:hypothetical protein LCGC14_2389400 [marine sediment metagenome]|uniref:Large polyvalent protein associated domain-containing protein n=1 Tax=marine sediment metagenome TaxID=412755 RepID=A0A0F9BYQ2_9ZZZZ